MQSSACSSQKYQRNLTISRIYRLLEKPYKSLCGYHPHTHMAVKKNDAYIWTNKHQNAFRELERWLQEPPILLYPDPSKPYLLFTDTSKYGRDALLCQYTSKDDSVDYLKPIPFISGRFSDIQCNYTAVVGKASAIYMSVIRLLPPRGRMHHAMWP